MNIEKVRLTVKHSKPYFPAVENAEKYIKQTLLEALRKLPEFELMSVVCCRKKLELSIVIDISTPTVDRKPVIENKINKVVRNFSKKYNTVNDRVSIN